MTFQNSMIDVHTSNSPIDDAGNTFTKLLKNNKGSEMLLLFSGGSSLAIVDRLHPKLISHKHTLSVLDERYTFEENKGNFSKLENTSFFKQAVKNGAKIIDPRPKKDEPLEETAKRFDLALKHWHITNREGIVIATVGIGPDGHTSGVLPMGEDKKMFSKLFLDEKVCAVGYETTPEKNPHTERITTTLSYIKKHVDHAIIYASGAQKKEALIQTVHKEKDLSSTPAQILQDVSDARLFSDLSI